MKARNYEIDFLKLVFACLIVCCHAHAFLGWDFCLSGSIGVEFFFIVSGVFFAKTIAKRENMPPTNEALGHETLRFMKGKIKNFYPYFLFAVIFAFIVRHFAGGGVSTVQTVRDAVGTVWELSLQQVAGFLGGYYPTAVSWYLSAMILAMWLLYPVARRKKSLFFKWICPLAVILINGVVSRLVGNIRGTADFMLEFVPRGLLRAISDICLGCICFEVANWLSGKSLTVLSRIGLQIVQTVGYAIVILMAWIHEISQYDFILVYIIAISVIITLSGQNYTNRIFTNQFRWMGSLSLTLYLMHGCWGMAIGEGGLFADMDTNQKVAIYFGLAIISAAICLLAVNGLKLLAKKKAAVFKKAFIKSDANNREEAV